MTWRKYYEAPGGREAALQRQRKYRLTKKGKDSQRRYNEKSERVIHVRWYRYGGRARRLGIVFALTFEQFSSFWRRPCVYCRAGIPTIGLDRVDNGAGYIFENVVACCSACNYMKRCLSRESFVEQCRRVVETADFGDLL